LQSAHHAFSNAVTALGIAGIVLCLTLATVVSIVLAGREVEQQPTTTLRLNEAA
jgi:hypothetical protein